MRARAERILARLTWGREGRPASERGDRTPAGGSGERAEV
jgi:hypothetical protein